MDNFLRVVKNRCAFLLVAAALSIIGISAANAASYTYTLAGAGNVVGTITTSCNNCVLNASNVTAWNLSDPGVVSVSSATAGSKFVVPAGATDMVAKPAEIDFNFGNRPTQTYLFTGAQHNTDPSVGGNNEIEFTAGPVGCESCSGVIVSCAGVGGGCDVSNPGLSASDSSGFNLIAKSTSTPTSPPTPPPPSTSTSPISLLGTTVTAPNQQIVDGQFNVWMLSGGQAYRNGGVTSFSGVTTLLYYDGIVYQEHANHAWSAWVNGGWGVDIADPRTVSAGSTTIPHETHLVDASHSVWTLSGGQVYANGYLRASSGVIQLLYAKGTIYQENLHHDWWVWSNDAWVPTSAPLVASASGTTVPAVSALVDSQLKTWTLTGGKAYMRGTATPSAGVILLLYYNGSVYQENNAHNWWQWKNNTWAALTADPRVPALASSAGYRFLTFDSTVVGSTSGTWQTSNLSNVVPIPGCSGAAVQNDDGSFTVKGRSIKKMCSVVTAIKSPAGVNGWSGVTFKPGMYIKIVLSAVGNTAVSSFDPPGNTVNFWAAAINHWDAGKKANGALLDQWPGQAANYEHWMDVTFATSGCEGLCNMNFLQMQIDDWFGPHFAWSKQNDSLGTPWKDGQLWSTPHTLEYVWVPASATKEGHIDGYADGIKFTGGIQWTPYNPASPPNNYKNFWSIGDTQDMALVTGTGLYSDMTVYSVQVWQASPTGATKQ